MWAQAPWFIKEERLSRYCMNHWKGPRKATCPVKLLPNAKLSLLGSRGVMCIYFLPCFVCFKKKKTSLLTLSVSRMGKGTASRSIKIEGHGVGAMVHGKTVSNIFGP